MYGKSGQVFLYHPQDSAAEKPISNHVIQLFRHEAHGMILQET